MSFTYRMICFLDDCLRYNYRFQPCSIQELRVSLSHCGLVVKCSGDYSFRIWVRTEILPTVATWWMARWWTYGSAPVISLPVVRFVLHETVKDPFISDRWQPMGTSYAIPV